MPPHTLLIVIPPLPPFWRWPDTLKVPTHPNYVGNYVPVLVAVQARRGIAFDDIESSVPAGWIGKQVSLCRNATFNYRKPEVMLLAGYQPGVYGPVLYQSPDRAYLGEARFTVTDMWHDD